MQEYCINISIKTSNPATYNQTEPLLEFTKKYLLCEPFILFDDILDSSPNQNKKLKFIMNNYFKKSQRMVYKNLLIYSLKGKVKYLQSMPYQTI